MLYGFNRYLQITKQGGVTMVRRIFSVTLLFMILSLSACAITHKQVDSNPAYSSHQYSSSDMDIAWKSEKTDNALNIIGTVTNVRSNYIYDQLELEASLIDPQGKIFAKQTFSFMPIRLIGTEAFKMTIPLEGNIRPERVRFNYRYGIDEDRFSVKFESNL